MHMTPKPDSLKDMRHHKNFKARYWIYGIRRKRHAKFLFVGLGSRKNVEDAFEAELLRLNEKRSTYSKAYQDMIPLSSVLCSIVMLGEYETRREATMWLENYEAQMHTTIVRDCLPNKD